MNPQCKRLIRSLALVAGLGAAGTAAFAQSDSLEQTAITIDRAASGDPKRAASNMAREFSDLVGSEAAALKLITGLRTGTPVTLGDTAQSPTVTPASGTGYGNVFISLALTQASLTRAGTGSPTSAQLGVALNEVLAQRASGMGWGQIAKAHDLNLGKIISSVKSGTHRLEQSAKSETARQKGKPPGADHGARVARPERPEKSARPDKPERVERGGRP